MKMDIKVPAMGESITEVTIGTILTSSGSVVKPDDEILELETDKVNQVLYAPQGGLIQLTVNTGDTVKVGQVIGTVDTEAALKETPSTKPQEQSIAKEGQSKAKEKPVEQKQAPTQESPAAKSKENGRVRYTKESFLAELNQMQSEPEAKQPHSEQKTAPAKMPKKQPSDQRETRQKMSKIRKVIANRLVEAQQSMAMLTTFNEIDLSQVIQIREKYKDSFIKRYNVKLGFMSFFVKAAVLALQEYPNVNSYIDGEDIVHREYYDIGIAVATDKGLIVPVVRNCDQLTFAEIEKEIENYAKKARDGTLTVDELQGGGFTITNGGVYGSLLSTPILNPPQSGILGMHKIEKRPVVIDEEIVIRSMMYTALTYDHRLIDGREAVSFLVHIKNLLEDPARLLLDL